MKDLDNVFEMKGNHMFKSYRIEEHVLFSIIFCLVGLLKLHMTNIEYVQILIN